MIQNISPNRYERIHGNYKVDKLCQGIKNCGGTKSSVKGNSHFPGQPGSARGNKGNRRQIYKHEHQRWYKQIVPLQVTYRKNPKQDNSRQKQGQKQSYCRSPCKTFLIHYCSPAFHIPHKTWRRASVLRRNLHKQALHLLLHCRIDCKTLHRE